jgi:hypothetical protein
MMGTENGPQVRVEPVTQAEGLRLLDAASERLLSLSGSDFLARWDAGEPIHGDHVAIMKVAMLIPLAR